MTEAKRVANEIFTELENALKSALEVVGERKIKHILGQSENSYVFCTGKEQAYQAMKCLIKQMREEYGVDSDETE